MKNEISLCVSLFLALSLASCASSRSAAPPQPSFDAKRIAEEIRTLASDEFEGRAPGTKGEELTTAFLAKGFAEAGLRPAGEKGSWFQSVPLVGIEADPGMKLSLEREGTQPRTLAYGEDFVAWTKREVESVAAKGELVFVGYGTVAPEFGWDDYKGFDCKGKILVMLVNDPPHKDESKFGGKAMTYYGRWTYKYEIGAKMGAEAVFLIHRTERAGYPFEVVTGSWAGEQFDSVKADKGIGSVLPVQGWVTLDAGRAILAEAGHKIEDLEAKAARDDFRPIPLGTNASIGIQNKLRVVQSKNVIGILDGADPKKKDSYIVYTAHWDHLGVGPERDGDRIYNGAIDNASGTAGLVALARAFAALSQRPDRSIVFLAVTAEEQGLLGSKFYAENPIFPLERTLANINMDASNVLGRTRDFVLVGYGNSDMDDLARDAASAQGRTVVPELEPEKGFFYRSDQFHFAKKGVPALYGESGQDFLGRPAGWGKAQSAEYTTKRYHKPQDEFDPNWNYEGLVEDLEIYFQVAWRISQEERWPEWKPGKEFKAVREQMLRKKSATR